MRATLFTSVFSSSFLLLAAAFAEEDRLVEEALPALPEAVSNNAVALLVGDDGIHLYSMLGLKIRKDLAGYQQRGHALFLRERWG